MTRSFIVALLLISPAAASDHNSHVSIPAATESSSPKDILKQYQQEIALNLAMSGKLQPGMISPINDLLRQLPSGTQLDELLKRVAAEQGKSTEAIRDLLPLVARALNNQSTNLPPSYGSPPNQSPLRSDQTQSIDDGHVKELLRTLNLDQFVIKSNAMQGFIRQLTNGGAETLPLGPLTIDHVESAINRIEMLLKRTNGWMPDSLRSLPKFDFRAPSFGAGINFSPPSWTVHAELGRWVLPTFAALVILVGGWFIWKATGSSRLTPVRKKQSQVFTLIDPESVSNPADLIRAFEHLALTVFGVEASHWHHNMIARRFAESDRNRADAELLARLYEQARYAPATTAVDWPACRAALHRLAGSRS